MHLMISPSRCLQDRKESEVQLVPQDLLAPQDKPQERDREESQDRGGHRDLQALLEFLGKMDSL